MARALTEAGWAVLARRWQGGGAELDLVVTRGASLRFVEVKARTEAALDPLESIGSRKQARLARAGEAWLARHRGDWDDVAFLVAVVMPRQGAFQVDWIDDAFDGV